MRMKHHPGTTAPLSAAGLRTRRADCVFDRASRAVGTETHRAKAKWRCSTRRGSIYIAVLGAATLVALIGLAALMALRIENRAAGDLNDLADARNCAQAAIEMGMFWVNQDPQWRTTRPNGVWAAAVPIGRGKFTLEARDPIDNNIAVGANDPVILTGTGVKGRARCKLQARLEIQQTLGGCLEVAMHSKHNTVFDGSTVSADQAITANTDIEGKNGAAIYANVEATGAIKGGTYYKATNDSMTARLMPDPATALTYYLSNGTSIAYSDLRLWGQTEILTNTSFETDLSPWYVRGTCTLEQSPNYRLDGLFSLRVKQRADNAAVAAVDLDPTKIINGHRYHVRVPMRNTTSGNGRVTLIIESTTGSQSFSTPWVFYWGDYWEYFEGDLTPTWTGQLTRATLTVTLDNLANYYIDTPTFYDITYPADAYVMERALLSPAVNPFGSRQTNAQGIYILNCGGNKIIIANSRIAGTLVLVGPGSASVINGSVLFESAVQNYPALLTDSTITIGFTSAALSESTMNFNFNPPGTPYPYLGGVANSDINDAYPSVIKGLVYSKNDVLFQDHPTVEGIVIAEHDIKATGAILDLRYKSTWLNSPPPGFDVGSKRQMQTAAGSWRRVVD